MIRTAALSSSVLSAATYDDEKQELNLTFASGRSYTYYDVPADVFEGLQAAKSAGQFFNENIKEQFAN